MARFYGELVGTRGPVSRLGHASSGIWAHVRGWNIGARVTVGAIGDHDGATVYLTGGSNGGRRETELVSVEEAGDGAVRVSVLTYDGGRSVFYVMRDGRLSTTGQELVGMGEIGDAVSETDEPALCRCGHGYVGHELGAGHGPYGSMPNLESEGADR